MSFIVQSASIMMLVAGLLTSAAAVTAAPPVRCHTPAAMAATAVKAATTTTVVPPVHAAPHAGAAAVAIVPFAVPVAVPVATVAQPAIFYGYSPYVEAPADNRFPRNHRFEQRQAPWSDQRSASADKTPRDVAAAEDEEEPAPQAGSLVARHCAACHQGVAARAGLVLSAVDDLSAAARLESIRRVLSHNPRERMPRGRPLSPETMAALVRELSASVADAAE